MHLRYLRLEKGTPEKNKQNNPDSSHKDQKFMFLLTRVERPPNAGSNVYSPQNTIVLLVE